MAKYIPLASFTFVYQRYRRSPAWQNREILGKKRRKRLRRLRKRSDRQSGRRRTGDLPEGRFLWALQPLAEALA
jgi:hypothetical protein